MEEDEESPKFQDQEVGVFVLESVNVAVRPATEDEKFATGVDATVTVDVFELLPLELEAVSLTV